MDVDVSGFISAIAASWKRVVFLFFYFYPLIVPDLFRSLVTPCS